MIKRFNVVPVYPDKDAKTVIIDNKTYYVCKACGRLCFRKLKFNKQIYCNKHYKQMKNYGHNIDDNPRTPMDKNECYIDGEIGYIKIYDIKSNHIATAKVDAEDLRKVMFIKWKKSASGYAMNSSRKGGNIHMSHIILNTDQFVDHINHDTMDNRKCNLRVVTKSQNQMNSNYKGVSKLPNGKYYAHIKKDGKMINLGVYIFEEEAYYARWYAEKIVFKEYRYPKPEPEILDNRKTQIQQYVCQKVQRL